MLVNMRPHCSENLNTVLEEMEMRFSEDEQQDIIQAVGEILGAFPEPDQEEGDGGQVAEDGS